MITESLVTLDSDYYSFVPQDGYIHPVDVSNPLWWEAQSDSSIYLDNGQFIKIRSVETNLLGTDYIVRPHESLASLGIVISKVNSFDLDGRYYFGLINTNPQTIVLETDDPIAYIVRVTIG